MTIQVKLFGDLKKKTQITTNDAGVPSIALIEDKGIETISSLLKKLLIEESETSHIFVNGVYSGFTKKIENGDVVSLFPKKMGLLYKWYFKKEENDK